MSNLNRRDFLKLAGKTALGAAAVAAIPAAASAEAEIAAPAFPWTWPGLDVKEVQDKIYANFFAKGGCCAGVASGILDLLAEKYGYPYNQIDGRMFAHGGGTEGDLTSQLQKVAGIQFAHRIIPPINTFVLLHGTNIIQQKNNLGKSNLTKILQKTGFHDCHDAGMSLYFWRVLLYNHC